MRRHRSCNRFILLFRSSRPKVFLRKDNLKICSKFTREHPCKSAISIKLLCNFIEIALRHECSPVNLLYIFRTPFLKNTSGRLLLKINCVSCGLVVRIQQSHRHGRGSISHMGGFLQAPLQVEKSYMYYVST